jgi:hypothetical protein
MLLFDLIIQDYVIIGCIKHLMMLLSHYCRLTLLFPDFEVYIMFCIGMACIVFFALFCIIPIIALAYALRIREGASEDDIRSLPMYRFSRSNVMVMIDDNQKQFVEARTGSYNQSHISELSLRPDDSVSTNRVFF